MRPAQQRATMRLLRTGLSRPALRHGHDDHRPGERPRRGRGLDGDVRARPGPRSGDVLRARLRRAGRRGSWGVALRRSPRVDQPHRRRRRARRLDAVLPRRRPGLVARCSARTSCGRSPAPRTSARELRRGRSTPTSVTAALISPVAPVDLATANRSRVVGGRPAAAARADLAGAARRSARRGDGRGPGRHGALGRAASGARRRRSAFSTTPKGVPVARRWRRTQREVLRALLDVYVGRVPEELADVAGRQVRRR